ncbi:MAG TPA: hypothetical protein VGE29_17335 [Prosthecobacter sp.]
MPAPRRPRPSPNRNPTPPPAVPLGQLVHEHEDRLRSLPGKPDKQTLRKLWQQLDTQHGQRPDYVLWRLLQDRGFPPAKRQDTADLMLRCLRSDVSAQWTAVPLLPDLLEQTSLPANKRDAITAAARQRTVPGKQALSPLAKAPHSSALFLWIARSLTESESPGLLADLAMALGKALPDWKLGKRPDLSFWTAESTAWPVTQSWFARQLAESIVRVVKCQVAGGFQLPTAEQASWQLTAWMLLRDSHTGGQGQGSTRQRETELLLDAAAIVRATGDHPQAARLTALALHLVPERMSDSLQQRCRVAAWHLMEAGLVSSTTSQPAFDELPFPGEPAASEAGKAAARQYLDEADPAQPFLVKEVAEAPEWAVLRQAGLSLQHPLAALSWIARKAQSYALKKQWDLLNATLQLAIRHGRLTTWGRLLPHLPPTADALLQYVATIRTSQRRMPFLRNALIWKDWTRHLRAAWGRLPESEAALDAEQAFLLHETLLDRETTLQRCLPANLRLESLRHWHSRHQPSRLVLTLADSLREFQHLEHQRQIELWSLASEWKERAALANQVWISLVLRGTPDQGRYSLIIQGPAGRVIEQERIRMPAPGVPTSNWQPLWERMVQITGQMGAETPAVVLALDEQLESESWLAGLQAAGMTLPVYLIPSWEWAFRVMREPAGASLPGERFKADQAPDSTPPSAPLPAGTALLTVGNKPADTRTRWNRASTEDAVSPPVQVRSLALGAYDCIISQGEVLRGEFKDDLIRLCLAQFTRQFETCGLGRFGLPQTAPQRTD